MIASIFFNVRNLVVKFFWKIYPRAIFSVLSFNHALWILSSEVFLPKLFEHLSFSDKNKNISACKIFNLELGLKRILNYKAAILKNSQNFWSWKKPIKLFSLSFLPIVKFETRMKEKPLKFVIQSSQIADAFFLFEIYYFVVI